MSAVFCGNDRCPQYVASGKRRFIGERDAESHGWVGFCTKCRQKTDIRPQQISRPTLQAVT